MTGDPVVVRKLRMVASRIAAAVLCAAFILPVGSRAQHDTPTVRFCFNIWPPYAQRDGSGFDGISIDLLTEASRRAGLTAAFEELPWNRCLEMVRQGEIDAVVDAMDREEFLQGPSSYSVYSNTIWVRDDSDVTALSFDALASRTVGLVHGYQYPEDLLRELTDAGMNNEYSVDDAANMRMLAAGRVDAIVADLVSTLSFARDHGLAIRPLVPDHSADRLYPSFNPDRTDLQKAVDAALAEMIDDGTVDQVYRDYLGIGFEDAVPN